MVKVSSADGKGVGSASLGVNDGKIVSIELFQGNGEITDAEVIQYVNIQTDPANHVDGTPITHIDRCGHKLRCKVKFDKAGVFKFKVKLTPDPNNMNYTQAEKNRNANFKYSEGEIEFFTENNGERIIEAGKIFVSPAGDDIFTISAKDIMGNEVTANSKVKTKRLLYYIEVKMKEMIGIASNLTIFTEEFKKHGIVFNGLPSVQINHMKNIGTPEESNTFKRNVTSSTSLKIATKIPNCIVVGYTDHLAVKDTNQQIQPLNVTGNGATDVVVPIKDAAGKYKNLWYKIDDGEWYVDCYFLENGKSVADKVSIPKTKCTPSKSSPSYPDGRCNQITIKADAVPEKTGKIFLKVNWVQKMRGGLSFPGTNIVATCTKSWWEVKNTERQNEVTIHEVGHQIGMVPNPNGTKYAKSQFSKLDKPVSHYDHTHVGDHCNKPTGCVMYGVTNKLSTFCSECVKLVKKVDLSQGI